VSLVNNVISDHERRPLVFLVGGVPPPVGGITVHIGRLAALLSRSGFDVEVFDTTGGKRPVEGESYRARIWRGPAWWTMAWLMMRILLLRPQVVHWHVSNLRRAGWLLTPMRSMAHLATTFLTVHSGHFPERFNAAPKKFQNRFAALCRSTAAIIGVSDAIARTIRELPQVDQRTVRVIPAYLSEENAGPSRRRDNSTSLVGIVCGFGTALYGWDTLFDVLKNQHIAKWHWVFYTIFDEPYMAGVIARAEKTVHGTLHVHRDLTPGAFNELLKSSDVLIRPTLTDGDSVVVREALALGLSVLASDAVARPSDCTVFRTGDAADIAAKLRQEISSPRRAVEAQPDFSAPLLSLFQATVAVSVLPDVERDRRRAI
jgi:glycogen(starch) synthase